MIALPAALIVFSYYIFRGMDIMTTPQIQSVEWVKSYSISGGAGNSHCRYECDPSAHFGNCRHRNHRNTDRSINFFDWFGSLGTGITGMGDLIIITLMAGGMLELIRFNGGVDYIIQKNSPNT